MIIDKDKIPFPYKKATNATKRKEAQTGNANKYPQGYFNPKQCKYCSAPFTPNAPSEHYCSDDCKDWGIWNAYLKRVYNITVDDYKNMYITQNGKCAICKTDGYAMDTLKHIVKLNVDHCHSTSNVRGLLCHDCNRALGLFKDNPSYLQTAINYLQGSATTIPTGSTSQANGDGSGEPLLIKEGEDIV